MLEKKRKDYTFWRQLNEKPSIIPGCPCGHYATRVYFRDKCVHMCVRACVRANTAPPVPHPLQTAAFQGS